MIPDELVVAADASGMNPLQYSHMIMGDQFLDEESESRIFNPRFLRVSGEQTVENLTTYNTETGRTHTKYKIIVDPNPRTDKHTAVVCVDGACKKNGQPGAEAAIGVYFGPSSQNNFSTRVPSHLSQTNQFAELYAVRKALEYIREQWRNDFSVNHIYIVTDSRYVVQGLSDHITTWRENGYRNSKGKPVMNREEFKRIDVLMQEMAEDGLETAFWSVKRAENSEADKLAKGVLGLL